MNYPIETRYYKGQAYHDEFFGNGEMKRCYLQHGSQWKKQAKVVLILGVWTATLVLLTFYS